MLVSSATNRPTSSLADVASSNNKHCDAAGPVAVEHPVWVGNDARVRADGPGMFYQTVQRGNYVVAGANVGYITDYLGRPKGDVKAPTTGIVTFVRGVPSIWKNATLINVGPGYADPPPYVKPAAP